MSMLLGKNQVSRSQRWKIRKRASFVQTVTSNPRRAGSFALNAPQSLHCDHCCSYLNLVPGRCVKAGWAWRPPLQGYGHAIPRAHGERGFKMFRAMTSW
jgi:hypothetical protein